MKQIAWFVFFLTALLANGLLNPLYAVDEQRKAYDQMVEEATREADAYVKQKQEEQQQAAEMKQHQTESAFDERVQAERGRLEAEMDAVRERGLGPNFTEGMRANQLQELQNRLNQLNSDPQAYFGE